MSDWQAVRVAEVAVKRGLAGGPFGSSLGSKDYVDSGVPVIRGTNLGSNGTFDSKDFVFVTESKVKDELARNTAIPGDVVFTQRGTLGQVGIVPAGPYEEYVISQSQMRLRVNRQIALPEFIYYQFKSSAMISVIQNHAITTGVPHINLGILGNIRISLPPLRIQSAIAEILGALDDKIAVNERTAETSLGLAISKYEGSVSSGKFERLIPMADCGHWLSGGTPSTSEPCYWSGEIPWISASSLKVPWIDDSDRKVTVLGAQNGTRIVPKDTVIFVVRGMSLATEFRIGLTQREVAFGQDCKAIRPAPGIDAAVLFVAVRSRSAEILQLVDQAGHGTGRLATDPLSKMTISLPGAAFSSEAAATLRPLVEVGAARQAESRSLRELRDTLLPKLMSGEIRVRDAEKVVGI